MRTAERHLNADINVTPFLDVLLVLIITFLASVSARKTMDAQLPLPCAGSCVSDDRPIVLEVLADGFLLNRQPVTAANLRETLRSAFDGRPEKVIQIAGHRETTYQNVLSAMDVARSAGITVISIPPIESYSAK
ncbi:MAG: biopolymer transporter ExbD [Gemmatimonadota bacterium]|nr:biopolymer transporter ExbD [Gemmatimonadota bacterium]